MSADILAFPVARRDVPHNTKFQVHRARRTRAAVPLWIERDNREQRRKEAAITDTVASLEMALICALLGSLNYGQALDATRTAIKVARAHRTSANAQKAVERLTRIFPDAARSAAEVEARS